MRALVLVLSLLTLPLQAGVFPMACGDLRRSNYAAGAPTLALPMDVQWVGQTCLDSPVANPLVLPDKVIVAAWTGVAAVDRAEGKGLWHWSSAGVGDLWSSPTWDSDRNLLYLVATDGVLIALDPSTGIPAWSVFEGYENDCPSYGSPAYSNNRIIYKNGKKDYVCLDPDTRAVVWRWSFDIAQAGVTPAVDGGRVYVAGTKGRLACLNESDGSVIWKRTDSARNRYVSAVTLNDDKLFVMTMDGKVEARLRSNGNLVWIHQADSYGFGNLACDGNRVYCSTDDRNVRALNCNTGNLDWIQTHEGNFARSSPFVCGNQVLTSGCTGSFYGDNQSTGSNDWNAVQGADNSFNDFAYADGMVYVCNSMGAIYCFRGACPACTATVTPSVSPTLTASPSFTSTATPTFTATATITTTATPSNSPSSTISFSPSLTWTSTLTPSPTITATHTHTPIYSPTRSFTVSPVYSPTPSPSITMTPTGTTTGTGTASPTFSETPTSTASPSPTASPSSTITNTPSLTVTGTFTITPTPSRTSSPTRTVTGLPTGTPTASPSGTATPSQTLTGSSTPTLSSTASPSPSITPTESYTSTMTRTFTSTRTLTSTITHTPVDTATATPTITATFTHTPTITQTLTPLPTGTTVPSGIAKLKPGECITYPSPVKGDHMTCAFTMPKPGTAQVVILDARARPVCVASEHKPAGPCQLKVDVRELRSGVYFQRVACKYDDGTDGKMNPGKFTVMR